ncbi:MAG: glycosyltransferase family 2 protein [Cyanobacteria bacterium P01_F01_bin.150]
MANVSVIIPIYNVEPYIQATVKSVLDQTYPIHEIILVDDASPDKSVALCQQIQHQRQDAPITIVRQENRGPSGALNSGIRKATGDYIAFLDGDDLWSPEKIAAHIQHLETSEMVGVSFSCSSFIDMDGHPLGGIQSPQLTDIDIFYLMRYNPLGNGSAAVYRRQVLEQIKFQQNLRGAYEDVYFDEQFRMSQDIELLRRIVLQTDWQVEGLPGLFTQYRINSKSVSSNFDKKIKVWEQLFEKARSLNTGLVSPCRSISKAYELKYLARRAVRLRDGRSAVRLAVQSLQVSVRVLLEEPISMVTVLGAAIVLWLMPNILYIGLEKMVMALKQFMKKRVNQYGV